MIANPYVGIRPEIKQTLESLLGKDPSYYDKTHIRRYARTLETLTDNIQKKDKLLELGTSSVIPLALQQLRPQVDVTVTDFGYELGSTGDLTCELNSHQRQVPYYCIDLETMPLPVSDETFDIVICCEVLEHMDVDPMFMLAEVNRVLKPGGTMLLTTPNITSTHALFKMLRGIEPYFFMQYHKDGNAYRHNYEYSLGGLTSLLTAAGFDGKIWSENNFEEGIYEDTEFLKNAGFKIDESKLGDNLFAVVKKKSGVIDRYPSPIYV